MEILLRLIKMFEGLRLRAYLCPAGVPTIGYGATGQGVIMGLSWDKNMAENRLISDATIHYHAANKYAPAVSGDALSALADFSYNLGITRLKGSTMLKKINKGDRAGARREILKWNKGGGRVLKGLVARRQAEARLI
jgi:lysozyme